MNTYPADSLPAPVSRSRGKLWILGLLLLAAAAAGVWYMRLGAPQQIQRGGSGRGFGGGPQIVPVRVVTSQVENIDVNLRALGTVTPINTVVVRARLDGELIKVNFSEGQRVKAGQLLAEIDPRPYQVQLAQAQGQEDENQARIKAAQADLASYQKLFAEQLITRQQVTAQEALVNQIQGALQSNAAQVNSAKLNLAYTRIIAPIEGRLGLRQVDAGNIVRGGDVNGIVVITQMRPISVIFTVPEADLPAVLEAYRLGRKLPVEAWDRADRIKLADGVLQTIDNQIDTTTGTIRLRATFENAEEQLFPNQFVNMRLRVKTVQNTTVIPTAAVQRASFGTFVYEVKADNKVTIRRIELGPTEGDRVAVAKGLEPNTKIVLEGVDDLTEGAQVEVVSDGGPAEPRMPRARAATGTGGPGGGGRRQ